MSLFTWFTGPDKTPSIDDLIREGHATVERLTATIASVVTDAADGIPGAQDRYRTAKDDLAKVTADVELLAAAKVEHEQREAAKLRQARATAHREKVALVKADLDASVKHAERLQHHLEEAGRAYDDLLGTRQAALGHALRIPDRADVRMVEVRHMVAAEVYRTHARLNNVSVNDRGLPGPSVDKLTWQSNPSSIPPLAERLKQTDARTLAMLEEASP